MNVIKVKIVDSEGNLKGRAYTYKSNIVVNVGDLVMGDMAGSEKVLRVVETGIPTSEIEGLDYEIKTITGPVPEVDAVEAIEKSSIGVKFEVLEESLPIVKINYAEMQEALSGALKKYNGIVVTEETLVGCKATQKELASVRTKIDAYRKEKKRELSAPITNFENQCKGLISLIESAEKPIKDGIALFDDAKRDEKRKEAEEIRKAVIGESGLREAYALRLTIDIKHCNLSAKKSEIKSDLEARAFALKVEQDREDELFDIIKDTIVAENKRIVKKLCLGDFDRLIGLGLATKDIIAEVRKRAQGIYDAEHPVEIQMETDTDPEAITQTYLWSTPQPDPELPIDPDCFAIIRITGKLSQLHAMKAWVMEREGMTYKAEEQGRL